MSDFTEFEKKIDELQTLIKEMGSTIASLRSELFFAKISRENNDRTTIKKGGV